MTDYFQLIEAAAQTVELACDDHPPDADATDITNFVIDSLLEEFTPWPKIRAWVETDAFRGCVLSLVQTRQAVGH